MLFCYFCVLVEIDLSEIEASFEASAASLKQCPQDEIPEVAFVGRSNAGKSSTLNQLSGRNKLARVSKTPGRTRLINLFTTSIGVRLVDLPGYGYAKASRSEQERWNQMVDAYLAERANLVGLVVVTDSRHALKDTDLAMLDWSERRQLTTLLLLNKADKLRRGAQAESLRRCKKQLTDTHTIRPILFSATQGLGVEEIRKWLIDLGQ